MNDDRMMNGGFYRTNYMTQTLGQYTAKTFGWMFAGLLVTFLTAMGIYMSGAVLLFAYTPVLIYACAILELVVVVALSARIHKMGVGAARGLFFAYAILNGVTFSTIFLVYGLVAIWGAFLLTSLFFGLMALIGYFGNVDFSRIRPFMTAGLLFLAAFWVLSMFLNLSQFETMACTVGIFLMLVFTAYDTKKIRENYFYFGQNAELAAKASIFSALGLYLDFINLFLYILRFMGRRRD